MEQVRWLGEWKRIDWGWEGMGHVSRYRRLEKGGVDYI